MTIENDAVNAEPTVAKSPEPACSTSSKANRQLLKFRCHLVAASALTAINVRLPTSCRTTCD